MQGWRDSQNSRYVWGVTLIGLVLAGIVLVRLLGLAQPDIVRPVGGDFLNVWGAPQVALGGLSDLFDLPRYMAGLARVIDGPIYDHNWSYPLFVLWFFAPFSWVPYYVALALWSGLGVAAYLGSVGRVMPRIGRRRMLAALAMSPVVLVNLWTGQNGLFTAALALFALALLERRPVLAGVLIGLLAMKPQLGLLWPVALLALRAWRVIAAAVVTVLLLLGASLLVHGVAAWGQYLDAVPALQWALVRDVPRSFEGGRATYYVYQQMLVGPFPALRILHLPVVWAVGLQALVSLAVMALTFLMMFVVL